MASYSLAFLLALCFSSIVISASESKYPKLPFTSKLKWIRLEFAQDDAKESGKPLLFLIGKSWCRKCHALITDMENNEELVSLSEKFIMAKAEDEEIPIGPRYNVDGMYAPKIVFQDSKGNLLKKFVNEESTNSSHKYYYKNAEQVVKTMQLVLKHGDIGSGFGQRYDWVEYTAALEIAKADNKPIMLIIHQDWCAACQRLKPKIANSSDIHALSEKFIMVNSDDDEVTKNKDYDIDGEYYPRILFLDPNGKVLKDMWNIGTKHSHVKFYYGDEEEVASSMKRVLDALDSALDRGFGKDIRWVSVNDAVAKAKEEKKPIFMIIHKSYCGACKALKLRVRKSKEFAEMSKNFIMVNAEDEEEPDDPQFDIDGAYVPRILFLDPNGNVEPSLYNEEEEFNKVRYAYGKMNTVIKNMKRALEMGLGTRVGGMQEQTKKEEKKETEEIQGFAPGYEWTPLEKAEKEARKSHRAIMYIIYSGWCSFSKANKEMFKNSQLLKEWSTRFVMVAIQDDKTDVPDKMDIDGKYTPRILFADMSGQIKRQINNTRSNLNNTKFYYATAEEVIYSMQYALELIDTDLSRGFGQHLDWQTYAKGKEIAKKTSKPIFLLVHRSWCAACKALKPVISNSWDISQLREHFVMVNTEDDEEPDEDQLRIDGGYYPRIYILDSNAKVVKELHNEDVNYLKYKFSYAYEEHIVHLMNRAYRFFADMNKEKSTPPAADPLIRTDPAKTLPSETYEEGIRKAKEEMKPLLLLISRKTCPACKAVHRMLARDKKFLTKIKDFILIDIEDDHNNSITDNYDVDGTYVPRIFFLNPEGEIWKDIWNVGTQYQDNKYYYYETVSIMRSMDKALKAFQEYRSKLKDEL